MSGTAIPIALIRHGATAWNEEGRVQGARDIALSPAGRAAVARWRLPPGLEGFTWHSSPLLRAQETASLLGIAAPRRDARLAEMRWGDWEGCRLAELRSRLGPEMAANEARGFDFRPPGGESPREVVARFHEWLAERIAEGRPVAALTHRGLIRAVVARAIGWNLVGKPPFKLVSGAVHVFRAEAAGKLALEALNLPLDGRARLPIAS